jgi:hypothetical protein
MGDGTKGGPIVFVQPTAHLHVARFVEVVPSLGAPQRGVRAIDSTLPPQRRREAAGVALEGDPDQRLEVAYG